MLINGIKIEFLKLKRTGIYWFIYIIPAIFTIVNGILYAGSSKQGYEILRAVTFQIFLTFLYPLLIGVITALLIRMERKDYGLNNQLILPISRTRVYLNKLVLLVFLNLMIVITIYLVLAIYTLVFQAKGYSILEEIPHFVCIWLSGCLISSIQLLLSFQFSGVLVPIAFCTILTMTGMFASAQKTLSMIDFWTYPVLSAFNGYNLFLIGTVSFILTCLFTILGMYLFKNKWINQIGKQ